MKHSQMSGKPLREPGFVLFLSGTGRTPEMAQFFSCPLRSSAPPVFPVPLEYETQDRLFQGT
jgi:hypothetical protein